MKKYISILALSLLISVSYGQSFNESKKLFLNQRYQSAEKELRQVLAATPADAAAVYLLTLTYLEEKDTAKAAVLLDNLPVEAQNAPLAKVAKGYLQLVKSDSSVAKQLFNEAIGSSRKKDPAVQLAVAQANIDAAGGNANTALELLQEAQKRDKHNPSIFIAMGDAYRKIYDGSAAYRAYQQALEEDRNNAEANFKLGKIFQTQDNPAIFLDYYGKALAANPDYAPVYYQQYYYYYTKDAAKALDNLKTYISLSDPSIENDYLLTDMRFINRQYKEALEGAKKLLAKGGDSKPRLYKLMAYSYWELKDYLNAEKQMQIYFKSEADSNYAEKDFSFMAALYDSSGREDDAIGWYEKAFDFSKDSAIKLGYAKNLAAVYKKNKDYASEARWLAKQYVLNPVFNNVDLFNWGVANYNAKNFKMADSVFALYEEKYPEQTFGYYWRAKSNAAIDTAMEVGLAVPHYEDLVKVAQKDTANRNNKKWLIQAYGYLAAYKANNEKKYDDALNFYEKVLELDPGNDDAERYKGMLEKMIAKGNN